MFKHLQQDNNSIKFIMYVKTYGTKNCYKKRAKILNDIIPAIDEQKFSKLSNNAVLLECSVNVFALAQKIFSEISECQVTLICQGNCDTKTKKIKENLLPNTILKESCSGYKIFDFLTKDSVCSSCTNVVKVKFNSSSKYKIN